MARGRFKYREFAPHSTLSTPRKSGWGEARVGPRYAIPTEF
jgi:hypothetical protein